MPNSSNSLSRGTRLVYAAQSLTEIKAAYADTLRHYLEGTKKFDNITSYMGCSFLQGSDGVVHGTPQAIAYKYHNQTNMVAVFYVNSQNFPMVLTSGDGLNAGSHKLLPLGKDPQNVYLGWFRPEESMVPYYLSDSKGDIFYLFYKRNGTLHYAAFDAFGADPIDGGVDHDLGLEMVDYVSIVAGPQGSAKPYLFWNTPKSGISNEIPSYLNTCQLQLNNSDPNYKN
ncbi:hypothetical protein, partial [Pandoraea horticolens]|uniref:hypothetical protein n=1 Tax=Pandoraea horticolens TaxID=2508298 RepID=UPI00123EFB5F